MAKAQPDPSVPAWSKVAHYANQLFDALEALKEAGGSSRAAEASGWKPKAYADAAALTATRDALDAEIGRLEAMRRRGR